MENLSLWILVALGIAVIYVIITYNRGIGLRNFVQEAFATMDVYLKKRWDMVPNLIEVVKGYAEHEKSLLSDLTQLRAKAYNNMSEAEKIETNTVLGRQLAKIIAVAENYPDLKANQSYMLLMQQLSGIEEDIANARKYYNGTVRELNTFLEVFPSNIIGNMFGLQKAKMFEIDETERENVKVKM